MGTLHIILNIVLILASAALVVSVLMQKTKSSGLGSAFGSDTASFNTAAIRRSVRKPSCRKSRLYWALLSPCLP